MPASQSTLPAKYSTCWKGKKTALITPFVLSVFARMLSAFSHPENEVMSGTGIGYGRK